MRLTFCAVSLVLVLAACNRVTSPSERPRSPAPSGVEQRTIAATHFFGEAPDKTKTFGPVNSIVGPGVELTGFGVTAFVNGQPLPGFIDIDFSPTGILLTLTRDQSSGYFDSLRFENKTGTPGLFSDATLDPATTYAGFTTSRLHVDADRIDLNLTALRGLRSQRISLDVNLQR